MYFVMLFHGLELYKVLYSDLLLILHNFTAFSRDLDNELFRVEKAGWKILKLKKQISLAHGSMALILGTEGNRIALH